MFAIYEKTINNNELSEIFDSAKEAGTYSSDKFARRIAEAVFNNLETVDAAIESKLNKRVLSRVPSVSLAIMRLSCAEMMFIEEVPNNISINEAVTLAKKYCADDYTYINAILGAIYADLEDSEKAAE